MLIMIVMLFSLVLFSLGARRRGQSPYGPQGKFLIPYFLKKSTELNQPKKSV
ncbi:MAG: hypothetical protein CM15mP84_10580 [Cellvibrionales bacterium]|nr:MAG: hypothetical protein CM15mP84_10580 [Cellvibrionales bacterium]